MVGGMSETTKFMHHGAAAITPNILKGVHKKLPFLKLKFNELNDPAFPHLSDQLEFRGLFGFRNLVRGPAI